MFVKHIPNILTAFRFVLVFPFLFFVHGVLAHDRASIFPLIIFVSILVSDVLDGYLARKLNSATASGAKFDIISDAFYSISSLVLFAYHEIIPVWFPVIVGLKLLEFIVTSKIIKTKRKSNADLFFDKIGKMAIIIVMVMPGIFVFSGLIPDYKIAMNMVAYFVTALFMASFVNRMVLVLRR